MFPHRTFLQDTLIEIEYKAPDDLELLGKRIREARKAKGYTQEQLARISLIKGGRTLISKLERGKADVKFLVLCDLVNFLDRDIAYFTVGIPAHVDRRNKPPKPSPLL